MKKLLLSILVLAMFITGATAQTNIANYTFAKTIGTYVPLSSPTILGSATAVTGATTSLDGTNYRVAFPGGFTFSYGGVAQTDININSNGYIGFGTAIWTGNTTSPLANTPTGGTTNGIIAGFARDLNAVYNTTASVIGDISYELVGTAPDRELVVQFKNFKPYSGVVDSRLLNFQIRLFESTHTTAPNNISVIYGNCNIGNATATDIKVGIRGNSTNYATNINSLMIGDIPAGTNCDWTNVVTGFSATSNLIYTTANTTVSIPNGLIFTWAPPAVTVSPVRTFSTVASVTQSGATISWTAPAGATQYNVQYRIPGSCAWTTFTGSPVSTNSVALTGLSQATIYQVRVQSSDGTNNAIFSHIPDFAGTGNGYTTGGTFTTTASCPVPSSLSVNALSSTSANFTWTAGGTESAWDVYYGSSPLTPPTASTIPTATTSVASYSASSLVPSTAYSVYVRANCGGGDLSIWTPVKTFTTPCSAIVSLPWTEGFEGMGATGAGLLPSCWTYTNLVGTNSPGTSASNDTYRAPRTGSNFMYNQWSTTAWVFTPGFQLNAGVSYDFSFYMMNKTGDLPFTLDVAYGSSATDAAMTNVLLSAYSATNTSYTQFKYTFVPSATGTYYFGTKGTSTNSTPWYLSFDDFLLEPTPSCVAPTALTNSQLSSTSASFSWTPGGSETAWDVYYGPSPLGSPTATTVPTATTATASFTATGLTANTNYALYVRANCGGGNFSSWAGAINFYTGYCIPAPTSVDNLGIINVDINSGEINNPSAAETGNYGDYSSQVANVYQNTSVPFGITFDTDIYDYNTKIWIDFNDDLDFNDAGENVYTGLSASTSPNTLNGMINIPAGANIGTHRLRIGATDSGTPTPCYTGTYGTFEDYSINIQVPPACTLTPVAGVISGPSTATVNTINSYTISPSAGNLQWYSSSSANGPWNLIAGATNSIQNITAVGNGTVYYTVIASGLGCTNDTANISLPVTVVFPGDAVCNAIPLSIGTSAPYNIFGATTQTGEVAPPASGFSNNTGWGDNVLHNTMWFSFVAPSSGYVTVQSPGFDTQLAVWKANTCNDLLSSATATLVAANDDDTDYTLHGGELYSSFVHAACLTPGATYYIQLDSYDPAVSTNSTTIVITDMGSPLNTSFSGLSANYCLPTGSNTLTPALTGGIFTINTNTTAVNSFSASAAGTYTVNYSLYGCKSSSVTSVNPNPTITVVASNTAICNGSSGTFTASGATNYTWSPAGGTSAIAVVSPTTTSTYTVVGQSALGCSSTETVALVVNNGPVLSISPSSTVICSGGSASATLTASSSSSNYTWSPSGNNAAVEVVSPGANTVYTVTSDNAGCTSTSTIAIAVNTTPTVTVTSSNNNFCSGSSATLTASGANNYTWTPSGDLTAVSVVTPGSSSTYTVVGESLGCSATATVSLTVTSTPTVSATSSSSFVCSGNSATLTAVSSTADYTWSPAGGTADIAIVSPGANTTYTVTSTNGTCVGTATVSVNILNAPTLSVSPLNTTACTGSSVSLTASGADTYTWSSGGGNLATAVFTPTAMATYTVTGSNMCGNASASATVNVESPLTLSASTSATLICSGIESATLSVTGTATSYTWSPGGQTSANVVVSPTITTIYTVTASNACGAVTSTITQNVQNCTGIEDLFSSSMNVYPNPTTDFVNFSIPPHLVGQVKLEMFDALGKSIVVEDLTKEITTLKITKFEPGVYMFKLIDSNGDVKIGRLIKQ